MAGGVIGHPDTIWGDLATRALWCYGSSGRLWFRSWLSRTTYSTISYHCHNSDSQWCVLPLPLLHPGGWWFYDGMWGSLDPTWDRMGDVGSAEQETSHPEMLFARDRVEDSNPMRCALSRSPRAKSVPGPFAALCAGPLLYSSFFAPLAPLALSPCAPCRGPLQHFAALCSTCSSFGALRTLILSQTGIFRLFANRAS